MNNLTRIALGLGLALALVARTAHAGSESQVWSGYLDYAYVYSSADANVTDSIPEARSSLATARALLDSSSTIATRTMLGSG